MSNRSGRDWSFFIAIVLATALFGPVAEASPGTTSGTNSVVTSTAHAKSEQTCLELSTSDDSYSQAATRLVNTKFVKNWMNGLGNKRLALGNHVDKTEFVDSHCYWVISVYESDEEHMLIWNTFRLRQAGGKIYLRHPDGADISLKERLSKKM